MNITAIPRAGENRSPAIPAPAAEGVHTSLLLAGCNRNLRDLCRSLGDSFRVKNQHPLTEDRWGSATDTAPSAIILLDPRAGYVDPRQLADELSAYDTHARLMLVGAHGDPLVDLYLELLACHDIRVDHVLQLPATKEMLEAAIAKVRNLPDRRPTQPATLDWQAPTAATFLFQPQFSACTLEQSGAEALARIHHPKLGLINPLQIPELKNDQKYLDGLFWEAIDQSLSALRKWSNRGYAGTVSINVSAATLRQPDLTTCLNERVEAYGLQSKRVVLELVESSQIEDDPVVFDTLVRLCREDYLLSMDDFGQGYSSLSQLSRIPFGEVKLDYSLTARLRWSDRARKLIPAIIDLAHRLGMTIVAEGIEEQSQLDFVRLHRCNTVQGFLLDPMQEFGKPTNPNDPVASR